MLSDPSPLPQVNGGRESPSVPLALAASVLLASVDLPPPKSRL